MAYVFPNINNDEASIVFVDSTLSEEEKQKGVYIETLPADYENRKRIMRVDVETKKVWADYNPFYDFIVSSDKTTILSDGIDAATVTVKLHDYEGLHVVGSNMDVTFNVGGVEKTMSLIDGVVSIEITTDVVGDIVVSCHAPNVTNGEVTINAE